MKLNDNQTGGGKFIRVIPQLTFSRSRISLIAEESVAPFAMGSVVKIITPATLSKMTRPLKCALNSKGSPMPVLRK